jgi:DNA excision repair protein ERCC-4
VAKVQPVWVVLDVHEGERPRALLEEHGALVKTRRLGAGDYLLGAGVVVERKTVLDLHATLVSGRLWRQIGLIRTYPRPFLLVEGTRLDDGPVSPDAIRGALVAVMEQRVGVLRTDDLPDSMRWLYRLAHRGQGNRRRDRPFYAQRPQSRSIAEAAEALLAAAPGISVTTARALLARFGTVRAVLGARPEEWREVPGVGSVRADCLTRALDHDFRLDPPPP